MQGNIIEQIEFSNKYQLKSMQGIFKTYAFQGIFFRFSSSLISITKIQGINQCRQIIINNDDIAKEFLRLSNATDINKCKIMNVFPQHQRIYLIIQIEESFFLVEIKILETTIDPQYKKIFDGILRIQNPRLLYQSMENSIVSYRFFEKSQGIKNDKIVILFKHQQRQVFNLLRANIREDALYFYQAFSQKQIQGNGKIQSVYLTQHQFTFIFKSGEAKVYDANKEVVSYDRKENMKQIVKDDRRGRNQLKNNSTQPQLVASYQTQTSLFYLFFVNSNTNRYLLIKWTKSPDFLNNKYCKSYSIKINAGHNLTKITCLLQSQHKILLVLSQYHHYYLFQINSKENNKLYSIKNQFDKLDGIFGSHKNMIMFFNQNSFYQCTYQIDQNSSFLKFSTSKHRKKIVSSKDSSDTSNKIEQQKKSNQYSPVIQKSSYSPVQENIENRHQQANQDQSHQDIERQQRPIIINEGNNRLSKSRNRQIPQTVSGEDQSNKISNNSSPINQYNHNQLHSLNQSPFSNSSAQNCFHNIPPAPNTLNPMQILKDRFTFNRLTPVNPHNSGSLQPLLREKDHISFNPSQNTVNIINNLSQQQQNYSFGVPPLQTKPEQTSQSTIQVPSLERGFSFGNQNQKQNVSKQTNPKIDPKKHAFFFKNLSEKILNNQKFQKQQSEQINLMNQQLKQKHSLQGLLLFDIRQFRKKIKSRFFSRQTLIKSQIIPIAQLQQEKNKLQEEFSLSFEVLSHNINKKVHEYELNQAKKLQNIQRIEQLRKRNIEKISKNVISFKLKLSKLEQQIKIILDYSSTHTKIQKKSGQKKGSVISKI